MPLGAMLNSTMLIGQKSVAQQPTGEWSPSFDYSSATPIACRLYDRAARSNTNPFGQTLEIDAVALVSAAVALDPLVLGASDGERRHIGRVKEIELKRWV